MSARRVALLLALAAAVHAASFLGTGPIDDDFIVYRYARNWVEGAGLVYQAGERVEGYTVPLWLGLVALGMLARVPPEVWSVVLGVLAAAGSVWLVARAWGEREVAHAGEHDAARRGFPAPALLLACSPAVAWHAVAGLGTTVLGFLLALWFASALRATRRGTSLAPAAIALGLAGLLRAEAVLFALPWIAVELRARRVWPLAALVPPAAWTLFRLSYYGRLLPVTYEVKKLPLAADLGYGLDYLTISTAETGLLVLVLLAVVGAVRARGRTAALVRAAAAGLALHAAYVVAVGGDYLPLARFFVPALPLAFWLACRGGEEIVGRRPRAAVALLVAGCLLPQWSQSERASLRAEDERHFQRWRALGEHFAGVLAPGTTVALSPIGIFGYVSGLPIVDVLGVTNTAVLEAEPDPRILMKGHHRHRGSWVIGQEPDVVILGNGVFQLNEGGRPQLLVLPWERSILESPGFQRDYVGMMTGIEGSDPLVFFLKRGSPVPAGAREAG